MLVLGETYFTQITSAFVYITLYRNEFPFFERYKAFSDPWPWNADKKKWNSLMWDSFWLLSINYGAVIPFLSFMNYLFDIPLVFDTSLDGIPSPSKFVA